MTRFNSDHPIPSNEDSKNPEPTQISRHWTYSHVISLNPFKRMQQLCKRYGGFFKLKLHKDSVVIVSDPTIVEELMDESRFRKR